MRFWPPVFYRYFSLQTTISVVEAEARQLLRPRLVFYNQLRYLTSEKLKKKKKKAKNEEDRGLGYTSSVVPSLYACAQQYHTENYQVTWTAVSGGCCHGDEAYQGRKSCVRKSDLLAD